MSDLEARLKRIEDKMALKEALTAYYTAIDSLSDMDGLLDCYIEDGVMDLSGLNLPRAQGRGAIRAFFEQVFSDMTHHAHFVTNFRVSRLDEQDATCHAYVIGMGKARSGMEVLVYAYYDIEFVLTDLGWKMKSFREGALMPLPESVAAVHGRD